MTSDNKKNGDRKGGRLTLIGLAVLFAAPMLIAYLLYYSGWRPDATQSYGDLVMPARPVGDVELSVVDNGPRRFSSFRGRWLLVYFGSSECGTACERAMYEMRQLIAAQGRQAFRVQAAMIVTDTRAIDLLHYKLKDYADVTALTGAPADIAKLGRDFETPAGSALAGLHRIYVVDPLGNFLISYPADASPSGMNKDLGRLLRASQIG